MIQSLNRLRSPPPISVRSEGPTPNKWNWACDAKIQYIFPGTKFSEGDTVKVTWYDGDQKPSADIKALLDGDDLPPQGSIFIGTKGILMLPHIATPQLYPDKQFKDFKMPTIVTQSHYVQFIDACRGKGKTSAPFDYSGPLTEAVLLGGVATRFPNTTLKWNAAGLKFDNSSEASALIRRPYRKGWEVEGL